MENRAQILRIKRRLDDSTGLRRHSASSGSDYPPAAGFKYKSRLSEPAKAGNFHPGQRPEVNRPAKRSAVESSTKPGLSIDTPLAALRPGVGRGDLLLSGCGDQMKSGFILKSDGSVDHAVYEQSESSQDWDEGGNEQVDDHWCRPFFNLGLVAEFLVQLFSKCPQEMHKRWPIKMGGITYPLSFFGRICGPEIDWDGEPTRGINSEFLA